MTSGLNILKESQHAIVNENFYIYSLKKNENKLLQKGSIVKVIELSSNDTLVTLIDSNKSTYQEEIIIYRILKINKHNLISIDTTLYQYLIAVPSPLKRLEICKNPIEYKKIVKLEKDQLVLLLPENNKGQPELGRIKYKGYIPLLGNGCYFGLDLLNTPEGIDTNDGSVGGISYFSSISNCGIFVSLDRLKPYVYAKEKPNSQNENNDCSGEEKYKTSMVVDLKNKNSNSALPSSQQEIKDKHLHVGDRVIWMANSPERGSIQNIKNNKALIEFDNVIDVPQELTLLEPFQCKSQSKFYIPLNELMKENFKSIHSIFENGNFTKNGKYFNNTLSKSDKSKMHEQKHLHKDYEQIESLNDNPSIKSRKGKKILLESYPIGEAKLKDGSSNSKYSNPGISRTINRSTETHIRHSYSLELQQPIKNSQNFSPDVIDNSNGYLKSSPKDLVESFTFMNLPDSEDTNGSIPRISSASTSKYLNEPTNHLLYLLEDPDNNPLTIQQEDLEIGSLVEVNLQENDIRYGVIRYIGNYKKCSIVGIEMEEEDNDYNDGKLNGIELFQCASKKGLFVNKKYCHKDSRFQDTITPSIEIKSNSLCQMDSQIIQGTIPPISFKDEICGKSRGIQGHHNSCYLDATLFSMFSFTSVFDSLLFRPPTSRDNAQYKEVQRVLREEIVNPLRKNYYVGANHVMKLRTLLEKFSSVRGLTSEEKDPEEFLTSLVAQLLKAEPFLKLNSGQDAYHYQLFVEKNEELILPSVQQLFEQSFLSSDIKLKEVPSCLIIQMPRFGKSYKMYPRILPSQLLDVTDVIEDSPRQCIVCGKLAQYECKECFGQYKNYGLESISFCQICLETAHNHQRRSNHKYQEILVPVEYMLLQEHCPIPRLYMELFAVVCIETSHYVTFVKCGSGIEAPWVFFDSMADRKGEQNGYNIPEIVLCKNLPFCLSEEGANSLNKLKDRQLPEHAKRLLCDAYMCMYQSPDVMMYR